MLIPIRVLALAACLLGCELASSAPIVADGTTYGYRIRHGADPLVSNITGVTFDGIAEAFALSVAGAPNGILNVSINESQTDLGGGLHKILIQMTSASDLFPTDPVNQEPGSVNIGRPGLDPLNLLRPVTLLSAVFQGFAPDAPGGAYEALDYASLFPSFFSSLAPWDGYFLNDTQAAGYAHPGGLGINRLDLTFTVQEIRETQVPEPQTLALVFCGLVTMMAIRRRRPEVASD